MRPGTAVGLSVIAHAIAAAGLTVAGSRTPRAVEPAPSPSAFWITLPEPARPPPEPAAPPEPKAPPSPQRPERARRVETPAPRGVEQAAPSAPPARASPSTTANRKLELEDARRRAAIEVLEERAREGAYRSLTFPGTLAEQEAFDEAEHFRRVERGLQAPLTAFDSAAKGRAGLTETTPFGKTTRWITDDCYQTTGTDNPFILPSLQALAGTTVTTCTPLLARGDLFRTAKPDYLMDDEERAATEAAIERRERLRRPTTGAVLPLTIE